MIVSFHPIIEAHKNIICAGRLPDESDRAAIEKAEAVILPQGCSEDLYRMARGHCPRVFPNLDVRFDYPGKGGQVRLFEKFGLRCPWTVFFGSLDAFHGSFHNKAYPFVVKLDWGGQGDTVFKVNDGPELEAVLQKIRSFEATGQYGFLVQEFIPALRSLRVVVIGSYLASYWRLHPSDAPFGAGVSKGAVIDHDGDPHHQAAAKDVVRRFCRRTGLQLAGFDFIFDDESDEKTREPLALEINYFFGRTGLGGSERYYSLLTSEVDKWLASLSLCR